MASRLNPYIGFPGNAREALEFYKDVFGGNLTLNTYGSFGNDGPEADNIMHGMLETDLGFTLMGADNMPGSEQETPGGNISVSISGDDADLRDYWEKLSAGGTVAVPLEKQQWGDEFGMCVDRFGTNWMINIIQQA